MKANASEPSFTKRYTHSLRVELHAGSVNVMSAASVPTRTTLSFSSSVTLDVTDLVACLTTPSK